MAFEAFRAQEPGRSRNQRRVAFVLVAVFHGVLIAAGVVYSYWHVEELTPPTLRVTFMSAAPPPPPPPPPPAGGGGAHKKVAVKTKAPEIVPPKPPEIVQPPEKVKPKTYERRKYKDEYEEKDDAKAATGKGKGTIDDGEEDGEDDGVVGGVKGGKVGGIIGGTIGGTGQAPAAPRMMPPQFGAMQKIAGDLPDIPASLNHGGLSYIVLATVCVTVTGSVGSVQITKGSDPLLNDAVTRQVTTAWRFKPMRSGGLTAPFCYPARFEFNSYR